MDFSTQQVNDLQEIEKQVSPDESGPRVLSQTTVQDRSMLINLLSALGITVVSASAVILLMVIPFSGKKVPVSQSTVTTNLLDVGSQPNVVLETEYVNPFSTTAQYENPFIASQNPFAAFAQQ